MNSEVLILYTRKGCCLCETLEKRLTNICLYNLNPSIVLSIIDIDSEIVSIDTYKKYTNEVPFLVLDSKKLFKKCDLPRVSPRLKGDMLLFWIQKNLNSFYQLS